MTLTHFENRVYLSMHPELHKDHNHQMKNKKNLMLVALVYLLNYPLRVAESTCTADMPLCPIRSCHIHSQQVKINYAEDIFLM